MIYKKQQFSDTQNLLVGDVCKHTEVTAINHDLGVDPVREAKGDSIQDSACGC